MPIRIQSNTATESLLDKMFRENKEKGHYQLLQDRNNVNTSVHILYQPGSKRPEEHFFQYFT